jgi:hypothetical protein
MAQEKQMSASQPLVFLLRTLYPNFSLPSAILQELFLDAHISLMI